MAEGAGLDGYHIITADHIIHIVFGDHLYLHCNHSTTIGGCADDDEVWQCCWRIIRNLYMRWYDVLLGHVGANF